MGNFRDPFEDIGEFINFEGIYTGPTVWVGSANLFNSRVTSLANLTRLEGFLDLAYSAIKDLGDLKFVDGNMNLAGVPSLANFNLEVVVGSLALSKVGVEYLPNLYKVKDISINFMSAIPYAPELPADTLITRLDQLDEEDHWYGDLVKEVVGAPLTDLVNLRISKPYLKALIDARLRGDLK